MEEAFNKKKGYVIFQDAQGFLDGMTSYKEAMRKQLQGEGIKDEAALSEISEKETRERIRNFFLGHYGDYGDTRAMVMRHPNIFLTHYLPEMNIMRYDYTEGAQDDFFKVFASGKVLTADGRKRLKRAVDAARYKKLRDAYPSSTFTDIDHYISKKGEYQDRVRELIQAKEKINRGLGFKYKDSSGKIIQEKPKDSYAVLYEEQKENKYKLIQERKALQTRRKGLRDKYYGKIEKDAEGNIIFVTEKVSKNKYIKVIEKDKKVIENYIAKLEASKKEVPVFLREDIENKQGLINDANNTKKGHTFSISRPKREGPEFSTDNGIRNLRERIEHTRNEIEKAKQTLNDIYGNRKQLAEQRRKDVHELLFDFSDEKLRRLNLSGNVQRTLMQLNNTRKEYVRKQEAVKSHLMQEIDDKYGKSPNLGGEIGANGRREKRITPYDYYLNNENNERELKTFFGEEDLEKLKQIKEIESRIEQVSSYGRSIGEGRTSSGLTKTIIGDAILDDLFGDTSRTARSASINHRMGLFNNQFGNSALYNPDVLKQEIKGGKVTESSYGGYGKKILDLFATEEDEKAREAGLKKIKEEAREEMEKDIFEEEKILAREKLEGRNEFIENLKQFFGIDLEANPELIFDRRKFIDSLKPQNPNNQNKQSGLLEALLKTYDPNDSSLSAYENGELREAIPERTRIAKLIEERNNLQARLKEDFETEKTSIQQEIDAKQLEIDAAIDVENKNRVEELRAKKDEIKLELEELRKNNPFFQESFMLDKDEYDKVAEDFKLKNPDAMKNKALVNIENATGVSINSFEDVHKVLQSHGSTSVTYRTAEGDKTGTVSEVIDKMFMRMAARHKTSGEQGGGKLFFPQLDVKGTLTAGGKDFAFSERIDFSRIMVGDFDADYYQVFHSTARNANSGKFMSNAAQHFGLYNSGAEYIFSKQLLGEGMKKLGERLGVSNMGLGETVIDEFTKEQIIKDVGGLDVQVKIGMLGMIKSMEESVAEGNTKQHASRMRSSASLVAMAQEVLAIKGKSLPTAAGVADQFAESLKKSYSTGNADYLFDFFQQHIFKDTILESGEDIIVKDMQIQNLNPGMETKNLLESELKTTRVSMSTFREDLQAMVSSVKKYGYQSLGSDARSGKAFMSGDVASLKLFGRMLNASAEGGMFNFDGSVQDMDRLEKISNATDQILNMDFLRTPRGKGIGGLAAGVLAGSYILGASAGISSLEPSSDKFSDMRSKESIGSGHLSSMFQNRDHMSSKAALSGMGMDSYQRPINTGETSVHVAKSARMYGEAPTYSQAMGSAQRFVSAGGQAYLGIQDNRMPISNSYINKSLRD